MPEAGDEIAVRTVTGHHRLSLTARGVASGPWINCATLTADVSGFGFASCVAGAVAP